MTTCKWAASSCTNHGVLIMKHFNTMHVYRCTCVHMWICMHIFMCWLTLFKMNCVLCRFSPHWNPWQFMWVNYLSCHKVVWLLFFSLGSTQWLRCPWIWTLICSWWSCFCADIFSFLSVFVCDQGLCICDYTTQYNQHLR